MYFKDFPKFLYDYDITSKTGEGVQAVATTTIGGTAVSSIQISNGGSGYKRAPQVAFSSPQESDLAATARSVIVNGVVTQIIITEAGIGYTSAPSIAIEPPFVYSTQTKAFLMSDITRNIRFRRDVLANIVVYDEYDIVDGETPEIVAEKIYGSSQYHWVIMMANERYDYLNDFPMTYVALQQFIQDKYGAEADSVRYYTDSNGYQVNSDSPGATSISNRQWEENNNESKRRIKIVSKELLSIILKNLKDEL